MSNPAPIQDPNNTGLYTFWAAIVGGLFSAVGGFFAVVIRARMDKKAEINYIRIALTDELVEICNIVDKLHETCRTTQKIPNTYFNDLNTNNAEFNYRNLRIFLIRDEHLRRGIGAFYKNLNEVIQDSINKVGKLGDAENTGAHDQVVAKFTNIKSQAEDLIAKLKKYKYRVLLIWY